MLTSLFKGFILAIYEIIYDLLDPVIKKDNAGHPPEELEATFVNNEAVSGRLESLRYFTRADRVMIFQYHNGGKYLNGVSMSKISCTYERLAPGIASEIRQQQNIFVSENPELHTQLVLEKGIQIEKLEDCKNLILSAELYKKGIKSFYIRMIKNLNNEYIGLLCIDYIKDENQFTADQINEIIAVANEISGYLSINKKPTDKKFNYMSLVIVMVCSLALIQTSSVLVTIGKIVFKLVSKAWPFIHTLM